jgi:beta-lactamase class A
VALTAAGHDLLSHARRVLAAADDMTARADALAKGTESPDVFGQVFAEAEVTGWLHAVDIDDGGEVDVGADEPVALASVFKVPLLVALYRAADDGRLRLDQRVTVPAERTSGVAGLGAMRDEAELSLRDLALLMVSVSDNAAADAVLELVGLDAVRETCLQLGLKDTCVVASSGDLSTALADDLVRSGRRLAHALADPAVVATFRAFDPEISNRSTPRDMSTLLARIWRNEAASPAACGEMRRLLRLQLCRHRLASGFPTDAAQVAGKTGTLLNLRSEIGVVELSDRRRYAVAVFTRSHAATMTNPRADAVIGTAARLAVDHLHPTPR